MWEFLYIDTYSAVQVGGVKNVYIYKLKGHAKLYISIYISVGGLEI